MANFLLGWPNRVTSGALSANAAETALPVTNLATDQGSAAEAWQCPATTGWFQLDAGSGPLRMFSVHRTNLTPTATMRVRVWAGPDASGAALFDATTTGLVPGYGQMVIVAPTIITGRTVRFDIADLGNPDGHLNIPQAFAGPAFQPGRNYGYASSRLRDDQTTVTRTRGGGEVVRNDWTRRGFDLSLGAVAPSEVLTVEMLDGYARRGNNLLFVPVPDSPALATEAVFGRLSSAGGIGYANNSARTRTWRATIMERL